MATKKRSRRLVLTPLSVQVAERVSRALGDLIASLPEEPRVREELALQKAARAALDALAARTQLGALFDDGSGGNPELELRLQQLARGAGAATQQPPAPPAAPPPEDPPPPPPPPPPFPTFTL